MSSSSPRTCMTVGEFSDLVSAVLLGPGDADRLLYPDMSSGTYQTAFGTAETVHPKSASGTAPSSSAIPCLTPSSSASSSRSFSSLASRLSSASFFTSPLDISSVKTTTPKPTTQSLVHGTHSLAIEGERHDSNTNSGTKTTNENSKAISKGIRSSPKNLMPSRISSSPSASNALDSPHASALVMEQDSPSSARKPLALLSKLKRQASALVKPSTSTPASPVGTTFPSSGWEDTVVATTRFPTVSFAPTPVPSISTFPTASSVAHSRPSSSSARSDADSSFLDCGDSDEERPRRSFTASFTSRRKARQDKTVPALTLFQNRNSHLDSQSDMNASQDDARSMSTLDTVETTTTTTNTIETDGGLSTESGDYIPYIPLVLRLEHERKLAKMQKLAGGSSEGVTASSMMNIIPATGRRTVQADIRARSTPSPTPSFSTVESVSTESPDTPRTPVFHSESTPSISINSEELEEDDNEDMFSITSSFAPGDEFEYPPNVQQTQPKLSSMKPERPFAEDVFSQGHASGQVEDDRRTIATTSESCYSDDSYEAPSEMYRRSRMESLVLPNPKLNTLRSSSFSDDVDMLKSAKTKASLEDGRSRTSAPSVFTTPPDIRVETASIITADLSTPIAADHSLFNPNGLLTPSPPKFPQKPHYQIGFGRQTVDPRAETKDDSGPGEWTLLLGEEKETSFTRARKASQSQINAAGSSRKRSTGPASGQERSRKKSGISPTLKASDGEEVVAGAALSPSKLSASLPFAAEPRAQKPLLRVKSLLDMEGLGRTELDGQETSDGEIDLKTSGSDPGPGLRRSGSAHPVLDGGRKARSPTMGAPDDWTLMLPLPYPRQLKKSSAASTRPQSEEKKTRIIHKARSSVDLKSNVVLHVRKRKVSSPMLSGKNSVFAHQQEKVKVEEPQQQLQHKKELSAEEMLAVILDLNDGDDASKSGVGKSGKDSAGGALDRKDHRQKALDMLSGTSTPSPSKPQSRTRDSSLSPKSASCAQGENDEDRSVSPSPSFAKFEERLAKLMDREELGAGPSVEDLAESQYSSQPAEQDKAAAESDSSPVEVSQPPSTSLPTSSPIDMPSPLKTAPKSTFFPFPSLKPKSNRPLYPIGSKPTGTMSLPPPPPASTPAPRTTVSRSQSLTAKPPSVVSRSSLFGLSFSQYGPNPIPSIKEVNRPSLDSQAKPSGSINSTTPLVMSRSSFAAERPHPTTSEGAARQTPPLAIKIPNGIRQEGDNDVEVLSPSHSLSSPRSISSIRSVSSASSTKTVVPSGKNCSSVNLSVSTSDSELALSPRSPFLLEDFPLPPASLPLNGVVPSGLTPESSPKKPVVTTLNLIQRAGEGSPLTRFPGADEDTEIPPPTPIGVSSPHRPPPPRSTPSPHIFGVIDTSVSQWMDDEEDEEEEEEEEEYTSDSSGTETDYEDARSTFGMSEEDYEDAVSMLSGVFYSARNSLDG